VRRLHCADDDGHRDANAWATRRANRWCGRGTTFYLVLEALSLASPDARQGGQQVGATWGIPLALAMFLAWGILAALVTHGGFFSEGKAGITCSAGR